MSACTRAWSWCRVEKTEDFGGPIALVSHRLVVGRVRNHLGESVRASLFALDSEQPTVLLEFEDADVVNLPGSPPAWLDRFDTDTAVALAELVLRVVAAQHDDTSDTGETAAGIVPRPHDGDDRRAVSRGRNGSSRPDGVPGAPLSSLRDAGIPAVTVELLSTTIRRALVTVLQAAGVDLSTHEDDGAVDHLAEHPVTAGVVLTWIRFLAAGSR